MDLFYDPARALRIVMKNEKVLPQHDLFVTVWFGVKYRNHNVKQMKTVLKNSLIAFQVRKDLQLFLKENSVEPEAIERYFGLSLGIFERFKERPNVSRYEGKIVKFPHKFKNAIWVNKIRDKTDQPKFQLITKFDTRKIVSLENDENTNSRQRLNDRIPISDFSELFLFLKRDLELEEDFNMMNLSVFENFYQMDIVLLEPDSTTRSGQVIVRERPEKDWDTTINLLVAPGQSQLLEEPIVNFTLLPAESNIPVFYVCDVTPECKYKTNRIDNFERHRKKCTEMSLQKVECKQKAYGDGKSTLLDMVSFITIKIIFLL